MNVVSVGLSVCLSSALWKNGGSDLDAVWQRKSGGSRDQAGIGVWQSVHGKGYFWGTNLRRAIVTNGDLTGSICASASTVGAAIWGGVGIYANKVGRTNQTFGL